MCRFMIGVCAVTLACLAVVTESLAEPVDSVFPYTAYILENGAYVRSGPGKAYYPTEQLKVGDAVEVYRHEPGGWLAIRPTDGSFSWVRSRYLRSTGDGLAEVTTSQVAARMGSLLDKEKMDVAQVQLHKGEMVELLDSKSLDPVQPEAWIKVRPPSGEFRWIHSSLVDREPNASGLRRTRGGSGPAPSSVARNTPSYSAHTPMRFAYDQRPQADDRVGRMPQSSNLAARAGNDWNFDEALDRLEVELSQMVASDPNVWSFNRIAMDAESLAEYSQTAVDRGRIQAMLSKIDRFTEIQARNEQYNQMVAQRERQKQQLAMRYGYPYQNRSQNQNLALQNRAGTTGGTQVAMTPLDRRFDGTGVLRRVQPIVQGAPNYALLDGSGRIICYVTPAPDVSLSYYENRRVGVSGNRGIIPSEQKYHIMVKQVQVLR